jgi:hypothetical protein
MKMDPSERRKPIHDLLRGALECAEELENDAVAFLLAVILCQEKRVNQDIRDQPSNERP